MTKQNTSTALVPGASLKDHAMQEITAIEAGLADLEKSYAGVVYDVTTAGGMEAAREARKAIRDPRYKLEKVRSATSSELTAIQRQLNSEAGRIKSRIEAIEDPIHQQIVAEEERIEAERAAKREAAAARTAALRAQVDAIKGTPLTLIGAGEQEIREAIDALNARDLQTEFDDVWLPDAVAARNAALPAMDALLSERIAIAERQAQLDREEAERQAAAKADAERRATEEAKAAAKRQEAEQAAAEARAADEAAAQQRREQEERERAERQAEESRLAGITAAINEIRQQAYAKATTSAEIAALMEALATGEPLTSDTFGERVQEAEAARAVSLETLGGRLKIALDQEEQAERLRQQQEQAERERLEREEADRQAQAQREQEAAQARAQAEADAVAAATLRSAAEDALALLRFLDKNNTPPPTASSLQFAFGEISLVTRKLAAALDRELQA